MENCSEITVTFHDVLCGRGGYSSQHPGNRLFRAMIKENKDIYQALINKPIRKQMLVSSIIKAIAHHGGRFLRKSGGQWVEISPKEAYTKTCHALRAQDSSVGSDSSITSEEGRSPSPQHSQFRQALCKNEKKPSVCKIIITDDDSDRENQVPTDDDDDVPDLISVQEEQQVPKPYLFSLEEDEETFRPLDPGEFIFESADEFSHLCLKLLEHWGQ